MQRDLSCVCVGLKSGAEQAARSAAKARQLAAAAARRLRAGLQQAMWLPAGGAPSLTRPQMHSRRIHPRSLQAALERAMGWAPLCRPSHPLAHLV